MTKIARAVSKQQLRDLFAPYGEIVDMQYPPKDNRPGAAYVHFRHAEAGEKAMAELAGCYLEGWPLRIAAAKIALRPWDKVRESARAHSYFLN